MTRMIREDFLQQSAYSDTDSFCPIEKQYLMLKVIMTYYTSVIEGMNRGITLKQVQGLSLKADIGRMKEIQEINLIQDLIGEIDRQLMSLEVER